MPVFFKSRILFPYFLWAINKQYYLNVNSCRMWGIKFIVKRCNQLWIIMRNANGHIWETSTGNINKNSNRKYPLTLFPVQCLGNSHQFIIPGNSFHQLCSVPGLQINLVNSQSLLNHRFCFLAYELSYIIFRKTFFLYQQRFIY